MNILPYFVYWLISRDLSHNLDTCQKSSSAETGFCLSESQCIEIVKGSIVGSCGNQQSGATCCKIIMKYFNESYHLSSLLPKTIKSGAEQRKVFSIDEDDHFATQYGYKSLSSAGLTFIDPADRNPQVPHKIILPVSIERYVTAEDMHMQYDQPSHEEFLYIVTLEKLDRYERANKSKKRDDFGGLFVHDTSHDGQYRVLVKEPHVFQMTNEFPGHDIVKTAQVGTTHDTLKLFKRYAIPDIRMQTDETYGMNPSEEEVTHDMTKPAKAEKTGGMGPEPGEGGYNMRMPVQTDQTHDMRVPVQTHATHDMRSGRREKTHNMRTPVQTHGTHNMRTPVQTDGTHDMRAPVETDGTHDMRAPVETVGTHDMRAPVETVGTHDMRAPVQTDGTHDMRAPVQTDGTHDMRAPVQTDGTLDMRAPVQTAGTHDMRSGLGKRIHDMRKSKQTDGTHDIRVPVQTDATHDMRSPVQMEATHDMRRSVRTDATHDMRRPAEKEVTHNMWRQVRALGSHDERRPVQKEATRDVRRPVALEEAHDLRWPVLDEESHYFRDSESKVHIVRNSLIDNKIIEMVNAYRLVEASRNSSIIKKYLSNRTSEERFLKCRKDILYKDPYGSIFMGPSKLRSGQMESKYSDLWRNASAVCGRPSRKVTKTVEYGMQKKWPWMVSLQEYFFGRYWHKCGATFLNKFWAATAAHCVDLKPHWDFLLKLNTRGAESGDPDHFVELPLDRIVIHPQFSRGDLENDLALLRMENPIEFKPRVGPICLPWKVDQLEGHMAIVLGWKLISKKSSDSLEDITVPVMKSRECEIVYAPDRRKERSKDSFVCISTEYERLDYCDGDSGGPLVLLDREGKWSLIGLVSWGSMCATRKYPGHYIRISSYAEWIRDVIDCYESVM